MVTETLVGRLPLFAVLRGLESGRAVEVAETLVENGFEILEVTMNSCAPLASIAAIIDAVGARALVGAGTVTKPQQIDELADIGARLIVSPHCDPRLISYAAAKAMTVLPGVFTPTEMMAALDAGASGLKIFPAELMPPAGVRALRAILPAAVPIYVVGGISAENMRDYLAAGATGFGLGGSLFCAGKALNAIADDAKAIVSAFRIAREAC